MNEVNNIQLLNKIKTIDAILYNNLEKYCEESRRTKTTVVELALEEYFKNKEKTEP